ncbi:MAG: hypothetical protein NT055_09005 [Nitrospirae bacterium]|nr:hypothetical protein [Nitrospirota bacterium]
MKIGSNWFIDKDSNYRWIYHKIKRHYLSARTKYQKIEFIDTYNFGRIVILDNKIQSSEFDEFIYHEALVHPTMIGHPEPKNILILGGGEGATLREVLKHPTVKKIVMVDIDEEFVTSDPVEKGPAQFLFTKEFYLAIKRTLKPDGIFVTHATDVQHIPHKSLSSDIVKMLGEIFPIAEFYYEYIPSFSSLWAFTTGSLKYSIKKMPSLTIKSRLKERRLKNLFYYDHETHIRLFCIPKYLRKLFLIS